MWVNLKVYKQRDMNDQKLGLLLNYLSASSENKVEGSSTVVYLGYPGWDMDRIRLLWNSGIASSLLRKKKGCVLKRYAYQLTVNAGIEVEKEDDFKRFIVAEVKKAFPLARGLMFFHRDTNYTHCHILFHPVCMDGSALRITKGDVARIKSSWGRSIAGTLVNKGNKPANSSSLSENQVVDANIQSRTEKGSLTDSQQRKQTEEERRIDEIINRVRGIISLKPSSSKNIRAL